MKSAVIEVISKPQIAAEGKSKIPSLPSGARADPPSLKLWRDK
jgi:hypothetical protein